MHLTNYSLQKDQPNFEVSDEVGQGTKRALSSFLSDLDQQRHTSFDQTKFWDNVLILFTSLLALKPQLAYE